MISFNSHVGYTFNRNTIKKLQMKLTSTSASFLAPSQTMRKSTLVETARIRMILGGKCFEDRVIYTATLGCVEKHCLANICFITGPHEVV